MLEYLLGVLLILLIYSQWVGSFWQRRGIKGPLSIPIFGNMLNFILARKHYGEVYDKIYNDYPKASYVGIYRILSEPAILVRDVELVKDVLVKNFPSFRDNYFNIDENIDRLSRKNPFIARGDNWKVLRNQIAPIFTPSKVKGTFPYIKNVCDKFEEYLVSNCSNKIGLFEAKDLCSRYTLQVVACCAFGLEAETFTNNNSDFIRLCDKLFLPHFWSLPQTIGLLFVPFVGKLMKLPYVPENVQIWLRTIVSEVVKRREASNEQRTDFLQAVLDLKNLKGEQIDETTMVGHATTFLFEGFETSSTLMAFCLYELAINYDIQEKLHTEIDLALKKHNGNLCNEALQEMTYLDEVMLETLRMHPAMSALLKICNSEYELPPQYIGGTNVKIPIGTTMVLPVSALHYDPEIYPEPHVFQPERFSEENQNSRSKYAFLAFGEGPRMCLGMKFGLAQSKAGLATILYKYRVKMSSKSKVPIPISTTTFLLSAKDGIWVQLVGK